jgi:hypothetical protein
VPPGTNSSMASRLPIVLAMPSARFMLRPSLFCGSRFEFAAVRTSLRSSLRRRSRRTDRTSCRPRASRTAASYPKPLARGPRPSTWLEVRIFFGVPGVLGVRLSRSGDVRRLKNGELPVAPLGFNRIETDPSGRCHAEPPRGVRLPSRLNLPRTERDLASPGILLPLDARVLTCYRTRGRMIVCACRSFG